MWVRSDEGILINLSQVLHVLVTGDGHGGHRVLAEGLRLFSGTKEECENVLNGIMEALVNKGQWLMTKEADEIQVETFGR